MKQKLSLLAFLSVAASTQLNAASGNWNTTATGLWSGASNWAGSTIADGATFSATFNQNLTAATTVNLDSSRTIGNLVFNDPTTAFFGWTLANNGNSANILTLANGASKPTIAVNTTNAVVGAVISTELQGTNGFQKVGNGTLTVSGNNSSLSGQVVLTNGNIVVSNNNALGTGTINIALSGAGTSTNFTKLTLGNGITLSNNIVVDANYGNTGQVIGLDAATSNATIAGNITVNSRNLSGGTIYGSGGAGLLTITGQINSTLAAGTNNAIVVRQGGIRFSGGGSYNDIELRGGGTNITVSLGANNGIATNANVILGGNGNIIFDLNGFNQSVNGLTDFSTGNTRTITNSIAGTKTLTLTNTLNHTFGGGTATISGNLALNINLGSGITQTISSANSYNGGTTVTSGRLITTSSTLGTGGLSIANGATYAYQPTVAQGLSLGGGNLTLAGGSTLGVSVGGTASQSAITTTGTASASGSINLNIYGIPGVAVTAGTNNLVTAASGLTSGGATYTPRIYNASNFTASNFVATDTALKMDFATATALTTEYWKGGLSGGSGVWALSNGSTASNWASAAAGTATSLTPGTTADIIFSATGATDQGSMTLGANMSVKSLTFNDTTATTLAADGNILTLNTTSGITVNSGAGAVTLNAPIVMGGAQTWTNGSSTLLSIGGFVSNGGNLLTVTGTGDTAISGAIGGIGLPPAGGLTKTGTGTLTLSGNNIYSGTTSVSGGKLVVSGGAINTTNVINVGLISVGNIASTNAVLSVTGGTVNGSINTGGSIGIGTVASGIGSVQLSGTGTLNTTSELHVGKGLGAYAAFSQSGGTANIGSYLVVGFNNDRAVLNQSSGSLTVATNVMTVAAGGTGSIAVANLSGGTFTSAGGVFIGENGLGTLNVSGSSVVTLGGNGVNIGRNTGSTGIVNLGGGTLNTNLVSKGTGTATFNFNGGTLQANTSTATFMTGLNNAYVNTGGALIDTNSNDITIAQALLAPTGNGITNTGLSYAGSGYIDTPLVSISGGGGTGATAVANLDGSGNLVGITITNPGIGYTSSPTFALSGGGGTGGSITGTTTPVANVSGGLTKSGSGTLTLTGASTFSGDITVNAGTLSANLNNNVNNITSSALGNNQAVRNITVNNTATLKFQGADTMGGNGSTVVSTLVINSGGLVTNNGNNFTTLGAVVLNGGTLTTTGGAGSGFESYQLSGDISTGGTTASTISVTGGNSFNGIHLNTNTTFTVANSNAGSDLNVSAPLINRNANLGGAGGLRKAGAGTMTLTGVNTYSGSTTISNGTLALGVGGSIANSTTINVQSGATLDTTSQSGWTLATGQTLKGTGTVNVGTSNTLTVGSGANIAPGASPGTLSITGSLSFLSGSVLNSEFNPTDVPNSDKINVTGDFSVDSLATLNALIYGSDTTLADGTTFVLVDYDGTWNGNSFGNYADNSYTTVGLNNYRVDYNDANYGGTAFTFTVVPEPSALLLTGASALGLAFRRRRQA